MVDETAVAGASLKAQGLEKHYGGVRALAGVDVDVDAGEIHGLLGENGAGKSTLLRIITGVEVADAGEVFLGGQPIAPRDIHEAHEIGIRMIFQHQHVVSELSVADNFCLGEETIRWGVLRPGTDRDRARRGLARLKIDIDPDETMSNLSFAARQMVEIGKALESRSRVLILDEPTAGLGREESAKLFALLRQIQTAYGPTIIYVSHRLEEIVDICDRVTVLRDGLVVARQPITTQTTPRELADLVVADQAKLDHTARTSTAGTSEIVLRARDLASTNGLVQASFDVYRGETLGIFGLIGSGRTELLRALIGADPRHAGTVELDSKPINFRGPADAADAGIGLVPEDRHTDGLFMERDVALNALSAALAQYSRAGIVRDAPARAALARVIERLAVKTPSLNTTVRDLSGGTQQKVVLARWLIARARILLLDEPTVGVDVGARAQIYHVIDQLRDGGMAVVLASSDVDEVVALGDRVLIMRKGRSVAMLDRGSISRDTLLRLAFGEQRANASP